jgi:signal transduction histidine kinase
LLNAHDFAWWMGWIDYDSLELAHFHIPFVLFAVGATIVDRHFQAVAAVEQARSELEGRVAEKAREIEASYARVEEAERERALARERQRIMADMHDGVGSSLVGLLGAVQSGQAPLPEVERRLHDALQELRLAVDALQSTDGDLNVILGNVRHRMRAAIESSGVDFRWHVGELPQVSSLTPKAVFAIERIVLEALTNSLRHARAHAVTVTTRLDEGWLQIRVSDDGIGFDEASVMAGRGLENLRQRARGLGGTVEIRSSHGGGTSVTFRLPFSPLSGIRHRFERDVRVRERAARPHLGCDPDGLHDFPFARAFAQSRMGVAADAIGALRGVRHRDRDQLLHLARQRALGERGIAEGVERLVHFRRQLAPALREFLARERIHLVVHRSLLSFAERVCDRFAQHDRAVVRFVVSAIDERDRTLGRAVHETRERFLRWRPRKFASVAGGKFGEPLRIVAEPLSQRRSRRHVLHPGVEPQVGFAHAARP